MGRVPCKCELLLLGAQSACLLDGIINRSWLCGLCLAVNALCVNVETRTGRRKGMGRWEPPGVLPPSLLRREIVNLSLGFSMRAAGRKINGDSSVFSEI